MMAYWTKDKTELIYNAEPFEQVRNVAFSVEHPVRREVAYAFAPDEGTTCAYASALYDDQTGTYFLYYRGNPPEGEFACVVQSTDGIHFTRPVLGLFEVAGSKQNNVVMNVHCHNFAPFIDTNPACLPAERFKAVGGMMPDGLWIFVSPDGLHWRQVQEAPSITDGRFDSLNTAFFDNETGVYRCYSRYLIGDEETGFRAIQSCTSPDFIHWSAQTPNAYPKDTAPRNLYTNATRPVPGAEHLYAAMPMRFCPTRKKVAEHPYDGVSDALLMFSRDGVSWEFPPDQPLIAPGLCEREWTQRNFMVAAGMVEVGGEHSFYAADHYCWDDTRLSRYTLPHHRFAAAHSEDGTLVTAPFVCAGESVELNYRTSAAGTLTVAVLDEQGNPYPGSERELYGNELAATVPLPPVQGRTVRLSLRLQEAWLYAVTLR